MKNPENRDLDNDSQDNFQDENIITQLIHETEQLRQAIEDRDNDPRDAIHQLEQRLNIPHIWDIFLFSIPELKKK